MRNYYSERTSSSSGGIGFWGVLQVVFIVLRLCGLIEWSWWWVWAPTWATSAVGLVILFIYALYRVRKNRKLHGKK